MDLDNLNELGFICECDDLDIQNPVIVAETFKNYNDLIEYLIKINLSNDYNCIENEISFITYKLTEERNKFIKDYVNSVKKRDGNE